MKGNTQHKNVFILLCVFLFAPFCASALSPDPSLSFVGSEVIQSYKVDVEVREDSSVVILETIDYDFGSNSRRGIFREIPIKYSTPYGNRGIDVEILSVSRDGIKEQFKKSKSGKDIVLRIGDPNVYIEGIHTYRITYEVGGAFNSFEEFDEIYWNAIGPEWNVPIVFAEVVVEAPAVIISASCYEGVLGADVECSESVLDREVFAAKTADIGNGNGLTIAVALPKGVVTMPSYAEKSFRFAKNNIIFLLPLIVFIFMFRHWKEHGKDAKGRGTIIPQYQPPNGMSPILMGGIIDGALQDHDIAAGIVYLAEQGYLLIERTEKKRFLGSKIDYILTWVGEYAELNHKEQLVAELIFGINVGSGDNVTFSELQKDIGVSSRRKALSDHIDSDLQAQGYFANKPQATTLKWVIAPILFIFVGVLVFQFLGLAGAISVLISALVVVIFGTLMPKLTRKGALAREHILGFKEFLSITEKDRLEFHNAPERTTNEFMEYLPFAIALGIEEKWAEQFNNFEMENPSWYKGGGYSSFNATAFASDLGSFNDSMSSGVTAAQGGSGSSGGGMSGGGMGGGGGGSW